MVRRFAALSLLVTAVGLGVDAAPAAAATECQGQDATIVGTPGARVDGTDGPDVIVTNGAKYVYAGAGDDLICTTAMPERSYVSGGAGDDSVVSAAKGYDLLEVNLGPGGDRFVGGAGRDNVKTFDPVDEPHRADDVLTGTGDDVVRATRPIGPATNDTDRIDLGPGRDDLIMGDSGLASNASVRGGPGIDRIVVNSDNGGIDVTIDARARTIERGGPYLHDWASFENYFVKEYAAVVTFEGSSSSEHLEVAAARRFVALMRGGDDGVTMVSTDRGNLVGGSGRDEVIVHSLGDSTEAWIDLARGHVGTTNRQRKAYAQIAGFEDATAVGYDPMVVGSAKANSLVAGCGTVRGGGGADRIEENTPGYLRYPHPDACSDFIARGGPGRDVLLGSDGSDVLLGGAGSDRAVGRKGRDRCVAEVERGCER